MARTGKDTPAIVIEDDTKKTQGYKLPQSTISLVEDYARFYTASTGTTVNADQVVNSTLTQSLGDDKAFQKWRAAQRGGSSAGGEEGGK